MGVCTISPSPSSVRPQRQTEGQSKSNRGLDAIPHKKRLLGNPRKSLTRSQLSSAAPTSCARILLIEPTATRSLEPGEVVGPACCLRGSHDGVATVTAAKEERLQLDPNQGGSSGSSSPFQLPPRAPHLDTRMPEATASHQKGGGDDEARYGTERNGVKFNMRLRLRVSDSEIFSLLKMGWIIVVMALVVLPQYIIKIKYIHTQCK